LDCKALTPRRPAGETPTRPLIDEDAWQRARDKERENKALLRGVRDRWTDIEALLKEQDDD